MAVDPLYSSKADLLLKIRLSTVSSDQTSAAIDLAISTVRLGFFNRLTSARSLEIAGYASSDNPTTENEVLRSNAEVAEALWVTAELMFLLPQMWLEGENEARQNWNDEALTRDSVALNKSREKILAQVDDLLGLLEIPVNTDTGAVKSFSVGRPSPYILLDNFIGKSIL